MRPNRILGVACFGVALAFLDSTIVNVAFPSIAGSFHGSSLSLLAWIMNGYNVAFAAFLMTGGNLADRFGRRRLFELGVALFTAASLCCAIAPSAGVLVGVRVVQGIGAAICVPSSLALVLEAFGVDGRARATSLWAASAMFAGGVGPAVGGLLIHAAGWRLCFVVNVPIGLAALVLSRAWLHESRAAARAKPPDLTGAAMLCAGAALVALGIVKGSDWGWTSAAELGSFVLGGLLVALAVRRSVGHPAPAIDLELLRLRVTAVANVGTVIATAAFVGSLLIGILFLTAVWRYSTLQAGLALTPASAISVLTAIVTASLVGRGDPRRLLVPGGTLFTAGILFLRLVVGARPEFMSQWLPGMVIIGLGGGLVFPSMASVATIGAPGERHGAAAGTSFMSRQFGAVLGVAVVVAIVGSPTPADAVMIFHRAWVFAVIAGASATFIVAVLLRRPRPATAPARAPGGVGSLVVAGDEVPGPA